MELIEFFHWNTDPVLITIAGRGIHWYGLMFALSFLGGYQLMVWTYKRENRPPELVGKLLTYIAVGTIIGARLGHVLFYDPEFYLSHPVEILKIWRGGLASHGGMIGVIIAVYLYAKRTPGIGFLWQLDRMVVPALLASTLVRVGNFFNSEIYGTKTSLPWAVVFERIDNLPRHPSQLYEALAYLLLFIAVFILYKKQGDKLKAGVYTGLFLVGVFSARFMIEFTKTHQAAYGYDMPLNIGQWLSIPVVIIGAWLLFRKNPQKK